MTQAKYPEFLGIEEFLFGAGLYATYAMSSNAEAKELFGGDWRIDGYCPFCHQHTVFQRSSSFYDRDENQIQNTSSFWNDLQITCARNEKHKIWFSLNFTGGKIQKVGQYPALATIANDEARFYYKILGSHDAKEFSRAIGLATHGIGIGSFVYLRRIFEHLVRSRFDQFRAEEGWMEEDFRTLRMEEKIDLLKNHLPAFLVKNRRIYGILSQGIHELDDDTCLSFFPILKSSIVVILEEDKKKLEELALQRDLERAIATFSPEPTDTTTSRDDTNG